MTASFDKKDSTLQITIKGRLDTVTSREFMESMEANLTDDISNVTVDCAGMDYISSSGLRIFMLLYKHCTPRGGKFSIVSPAPQVAEVLEITGMSALFGLK